MGLDQTKTFMKHHSELIPSEENVLGVILFTFLHVLLHPKSELVHTSPPGSFALAFILFGSFGLLSILFWSYFRFRKPDPSRLEEEG